MTDYNLGTARGVVEIEFKGDGLAKGRADLDKTKSKSDEAAASSKDVGKGMVAVGATIAGGFALAVKSAASFEKQMSAVQAVSGASSSEMEALTNKALQLGASTKFSASESASAIEELVKAGVSVPDVMNGAADATVALAAAGEVALPQAAEIASNALSQFGLAAQDMPKVADSIAGAANASAIDVKDFGYSLSQAGAVAKLAGLKFDDFAVAVAEMGKAGIKGSDAGTSLKTFLQNLQPETEKQINLFKDLGLATFSVEKAQEFLRENGVKPLGNSQEVLTGQLKTVVAQLAEVEPGTAKADKAFQKFDAGMTVYSNGFFDAQGNLKSLSEVQELLQKSTKNLTAEQKTAALGTLFGSDAIRASAIMAKEGASGFNDMASAMGKVTAEQVAQTRQKNLAGQWEQLTGSLETMAIEIGRIIIPYLQMFVAGIQKLVDAWSKLSPGTKKIIVIIGALVGIFLLLAGAILAVVIPFAAMVTATIAAGAPLFLIIGIVAGIVAALIALVVAVIAVIKNWDKIKAFASKIWGGIRDFFVGIWKAIVGVFKAGIDAVGGFFTGAWGSLVSFFTGIWDGVAGFFKGLWGSISGVFNTAVAFVRGVVTGLFSYLQGLFTTVLNAILAPWRAFWGVFGGLFKAVWDLIVAIATLAVKAVGFVIFSTLQYIMQVWNAIWTAIVGFFKGVWDGIVAFVQPIFEAIDKAIVGAITRIRNLWFSVWGSVRDFVVRVWNAVVAYLTGVGSKILSAVSAPLQMMLGFVTTKLTAIKGAFTNVWTSIRDTVTTIWTRIVSVVEEKVRSVLAKVTGLKDKVVNALRGAAGWLYNAGKDIIQGLIDGITRKVKDLTDKLNAITDKIPDWKGPADRDAELLTPAGRSLLDGLIRGVEDRIPNFRALLQGLTSNIPSMAMAGGASPASTVILPAPAASSGTTVYQDVDIHYPVAERDSEAIDEALQLAGAFGE